MRKLIRCLTQVEEVALSAQADAEKDIENAVSGAMGRRAASKAGETLKEKLEKARETVTATFVASAVNLAVSKKITFHGVATATVPLVSSGEEKIVMNYHGDIADGGLRLLGFGMGVAGKVYLIFVLL